MQRGSKLARLIDLDNRRNEAMKRIHKNKLKNNQERFIEEYCNKCINKNIDLCSITNTIDNKLKCIYYVKREETK